MANILAGFINSLHLNDEEEEEERYDKYVRMAEEREQRQERKGWFSMFPKKRYVEDEDAEMESEKEEESVRSNTANFPDLMERGQRSAERAAKGKTVQFRNSLNMPKIRLVRPTKINKDANKDICDELLDGNSVVINLTSLEEEEGQRIMDFVSGAVYAMKGQVMQIDKSVFVVVPEGAELSKDYGDINSNHEK